MFLKILAIALSSFIALPGLASDGWLSFTPENNSANVDIDTLSANIKKKNLSTWK